MTEVTIDNAHLILGIDANASEATIKKAFRKKALSCHQATDLGFPGLWIPPLLRA